MILFRITADGLYFSRFFHIRQGGYRKKSFSDEKRCLLINSDNKSSTNV